MVSAKMEWWVFGLAIPVNSVQCLANSCDYVGAPLGSGFASDTGVVAADRGVSPVVLMQKPAPQRLCETPRGMQFASANDGALMPHRPRPTWYMFRQGGT